MKNDLLTALSSLSIVVISCISSATVRDDSALFEFKRARNSRVGLAARGDEIRSEGPLRNANMVVAV